MYCRGSTICASMSTMYVQSALEGNQAMLQCLAVCACDLSILFAYCYCGEIVTQACKISNNLYHTRWYAFERNEQRSFLFAIMRTQKPYKFASFPQLNCSLETFADVRERMILCTVLCVFSDDNFIWMLTELLCLYIYEFLSLCFYILCGMCADAALWLNFFGNLSILAVMASAAGDRLYIRQHRCLHCSAA